MTDMAASSSEAGTGWQLLAEVAVAGPPDSNQPQLDQVMDAVQGLNLQAVQLETIQQAFVRAAARSICGGEPAICRLSIRIWVLGARTPDRGCGFFLVERGGEPQRAPKGADRCVELFLYQECDA